MTKIIDGKKLAEVVKDEVVKEVEELCEASKLSKRRPELAIILIGDREDSKLYVNMKEQEAKLVGIDTHLYKCDSCDSEEDVLKMIECLNNDKDIDAILVQLPLPDSYNTDRIIKKIDPQKDVDRFHPENLKKILNTCDHNNVLPPVFGAVLEMLSSIQYSVAEKQICVISNSDIFGKSLSKVLTCKGAMVENVHADDENLKEKTLQADVLITAVGRAQFIKQDMIKEDIVIIDIGIEKKNGKVYGDVDFEDVQNKVSFITPVPGGVGPMTIALLFQNTVKLFKQSK